MGSSSRLQAKKYSIVLPCYNESGNIPVLVERFRGFRKTWDFELILVDNGSTDDSANILAGIHADPANSFVRVVCVDKNIGYGHGIQTGLRAAGGDILAYSHADAQTPPEDIFRAFEWIEKEPLDVHNSIIKGRRPGRDGSELFTRGLRIYTSAVAGIRVEDINGQPKVFHRSLIEFMTQPVTDFSYDTYVLYIAMREGLGIRAMDVRFDPRLHGVSKSAHTIVKKCKTAAGYMKSIFLMSWRDRRRKDNPLGQVLRFGFSGAATNLCNYLVFLVLLRRFGIHHAISSVAGFFAGFIVGFFLNKHYTFGIAGRSVAGEMTKFLVVNLLSLVANTLMIFAMVDGAGIIPEAGQVAAILVSALVNFSGMRWWVFSRGGTVCESGGTHS